MNRRKFLQKTTGRKTTQTKERHPFPRATASNTSLAPYAGWNSDPEAAAHLLRRTLFGAPVTTINYFKTMSLDQSVTQLLTISADPPPTPPANYWTPEYFQELETDLANGVIPAWLQVNPAPPVNDYEYTNGSNYYTDGAVPKGMPWAFSSLEQFQSHAAQDGYSRRQNCVYARHVSFLSWWGRLIMEQNSNIREKMTLFWHNHFAMRVVATSITRYHNNALLRYHALGNFKELIKAITFDPQMMYMLDLRTNNVNAINENYARELQELFTLGLKPAVVDDGSSYTEEDVHQLARLLTGWGIKNNYCDTGCNHSAYQEASFYDGAHDSGDKQFSSFYNNHVIVGQGGTKGGELEFDDFLDNLFNVRGLEIGKYLVREIYRFFVRPSFAYDPQSATNEAADIQIETDIITPLANDFVNAGYEIRPIMEKLLKSEHFFSDCIRGGMIKSPIDFAVGLCRELFVFPANYYVNGVQINDINMEAKSYFGTVHTEVGNIGQSIDNPVNVYGWDAYAKVPYDNNWINGATFARRVTWMNRITNPYGSNISYTMLHSNGGVDEGLEHWFVEEVDFIDFTNTHISNPGNMTTLIQETTEIFLPIPVDYNSIRQGFEAVLEQGQPGYWASTWYAWVANPSDTNNTNALKGRLRDFYRAIFTLEEYHLM